MPLEDVRGAQFIALATLLFFLPQLPHIPPPRPLPPRPWDPSALLPDLRGVLSFFPSLLFKLT